ncbi:MAG: polynucleotide kinase-phosphatase [Cyanothece sp. SIO1E1]|nr:polynucleotide kinase-phosphatase [Cyanothece sp. SIO1E1]
MTLNIPELSLIVLIGASGAGKSTFARRHFKATEVISSDFCRGLVSDDETDQAATKDAFEVLHFIAAKRLAAGKLTVIDATNVRAEDRKHLLQLAREYHCLPVAIVFNLPEQLCHQRNQQRPDRNFGPHVVRQHSQLLRRSLRTLKKEGFRTVHILASLDEVNAAVIERQPLWSNRKEEQGPFDIIGDIHGCCDELETLLAQLGYLPRLTDADDEIEAEEPWSGPVYYHPAGRKAVFLGDLVDRGPRILDTLRLVRNMVQAQTALCVPGNHDVKLLRKLRGKQVRIRHGLEQSVAELDALPANQREAFVPELIEFLHSLTSHYVLDQGRLVVAHAGMKQELQGRGSGRVRDFALYGETTGEIDEFGLPVRHNWAAAYRGEATVVYGHTPVLEAEWLNRTIDIDTGCVFGGKLTALRYPEQELVSVLAARMYCEPAKPLQPAHNSPTHDLSAQHQLDDVLDINDVLGKRILSTRLRHNITIRAEQGVAALEVISRFAIHPKWLIYLPPTMSPVETSDQPGLLEHPAEAFAYYRHQGIDQVICEEKHMGSRAIVIVCRDPMAAQAHFGLVDQGIGVCYTRTGRHFFNQPDLAAQMLDRLQVALEAAGFWETFNTNWVCLDCELMPWSAKAQELVKQQYAAVGAAARVALPAAVSLLEQTATRGVEIEALQQHYHHRTEMTNQYIDAYRRYCWPVSSIADFKLAPFHILATEGMVHIDKNHGWHLEHIARICEQDPALLLATAFKLVDVHDSASQTAGIEWWTDLTRQGGEGMVVKPWEFVATGKKGLIQPAVKCRGQEYLRIIYGPEYTLPEHLERLRSRSLSTKRSLALREFALGIEALERFVRREPLRRVHECVFGVLALESEPVDPRL